MPGISIPKETYDYINDLIERPIVKAKYPALSNPSRFIRAAITEYIKIIENELEMQQPLRKK